MFTKKSTLLHIAEKRSKMNIEQIRNFIENWDLDSNSLTKDKTNDTSTDISNLLDYLYVTIDLLERGDIRIVEKNDNGEYDVNIWIKKAILLFFKNAPLKSWEDNGIQYYDKFDYRGSDKSFRFLPGAIMRKGAFIGKGTVIMPPSFVNVGAYVDDNCMIDSLALVGSCAQIGKNCHISAGTIIGGVLEPAAAKPVIIEDNVFIGGNCGIYEGVIIRKGAILGTGTIINASTPIYDIQSGKVYYSEVPENSVVVPGGRKKIAGKNEFYLQAPIIVKTRDELTNPDKVDLTDILHDI